MNKKQKILKSISISVLLITIVNLLSCDGSDIGSADITGEGEILAAAEELHIIFAPGDSAEHVTRNFIFSGVGNYGTYVSWSNSNSNIVSITGSTTFITRPSSETQTVNIDAEIKNYQQGFIIKRFTITVIALNDAEAVDSDIYNLQIGYYTGESASSVTRNIILPTTGQNGSTITWTSSDISIITSNGVVSDSFSEKNVILTALVQKGTYSDTSNFNLTVKSHTTPGNAFLTSKKITLGMVSVYFLDINEDHFFKVFLNANTMYNIYSEGNMNTYCYIYNSSQSYIESDYSSGSNDNFRITYTPTTSGYYYIKIKLQDIPVGVYQLVTCEAGSDEVVDADLSSLEIGFSGLDNASSVTKNLTLSTTGQNGSIITWSSGNSSVITNSGVILECMSNENVTLTATVEKNGYSRNKIFNVTVIQHVTPGNSFEAAKELSLGKYSNEFQNAADYHFYKIFLNAGITYHIYSSTYSWYSMDTLCSIYDSSQSIVASDDNSGSNDNFDIFYMPSVSDYFYIIISGDDDYPYYLHIEN